VLAQALVSPTRYVKEDGRYTNRRGALGYYATVQSGGHWYMVSVSDMLQPYHQSDIRRKNPSEEINMAKTVSCRDVGMDCDFVAKGETEQDILQQAAEHARTAHNMTEIPPEVVDKVRRAIRDEAA
jgi:predicted small metal-binding protein